MPDWLLIIITDVRDGFMGITAEDLTRSVFFCLWLLTILIPLRGVDKRDHVAGMTYVLFSLGTGTALVLAVPQKLIGNPPPTTTLSILAVMAMASSFRWRWRKI